MSILEFFCIVIVARYIYKLLTNATFFDREKMKQSIADEMKPFLIDRNNEYKAWHDEFLSSVIDANGDISKIMAASDTIDAKFKERERELLDFNKKK